MNRRLLAGVALSVVLLALLAVQVDFSEVLAAFDAATPGWLALTLGLHLGVLSLKAGRWRVVLGAVPHPTPPEAPRPADVTKNYANEVALGRIGAPEDIARVVRFLASDAAGYITGEVITASGGWQL